MKNILLESELKKIKLMMGYDPKDTLTENEIPTLISNNGYWEGTLDMSNAGALAKFKNNGVFPQASKFVYLTSFTSAVGYANITVTQPKKETGDDGGTVIEAPASAEFTTSAEDPFEFNRAELTELAKQKLDVLANKIINVGEDYSSEFKDAFYNFLKSKTITVNAYSSIDASSNFPDGGDYPGCSQYGVGKGPRKSYNKCLSQARAQTVVNYLKDKGGILAELNYSAVGKGETNKFSNVVWSEANETFPKNPSKTLDKKNPNGRDKTAPDRRFVIVIPKFTFESPAPLPDGGGSKGGYNIPRKKAWCYKWAKILNIVTDDDYTSKEGRNGMLVDSNTNRPFMPEDDTSRIQQAMSQKGVCWDNNAIGCDGTPGNYTWCENQFPLLWDAGDDLGLGEDIKIPIKTENSGARILMDENKIKELLGSDFTDYFYLGDATENPTATITKENIKITTSKQTMEFGPWKPSKSTSGVDFLETPYRYRLSFIANTGENNEIKMVGLQKIGFGLSTIAKMPSGTGEIQSELN
jgi:outer membrane protein OmpA-like peptidoglycan-associated protein